MYEKMLDLSLKYSGRQYTFSILIDTIALPWGLDTETPASASFISVNNDIVQHLFVINLSHFRAKVQ